MRRLDPWLVVGLLLSGVLLLVAFYGDRIAPHEPIYLLINGPAGTVRPLPPGEPFLFGSDAAGRDLFSLVLVGARTTLLIVGLAGFARLLCGLGLAVASGWLRPLRLAIDGAADIASAVPSTIVAVFAVLVFARQGAPALIFVAALLVTGWAGPYRVIRAELARIRAAPYTEGAVALGVGRRRLLLRHHLPHLVPVLAVSASQQIAAALVALAELGVIGIFVGPTRVLSVVEAMRAVTPGIPGTFRVPDLPEWGGLIALARGFSNLYASRWTFLVPGVATAVAAIGVATLGVGVARQYRRGNLLEDLRTRRALLLATVAILLIVPSFVLPPPHADAVALAAAARARAVVGSDPESVLKQAGLAVASVDRAATLLRQVGPAALRVDGPGGPATFDEGPRADYTPLLIGSSGGGTVDAPLVFAGWGVSPGDFPPQVTSVFSAGDFGSAVRDWQDDYATVDVRNKVVLIFRIPFIRAGRNNIPAPTADLLIDSALKRGAVGILWVDASRQQLVGRGQPDPYRRLEADDPLRTAAGVPIFMLTPEAADRVLAPAGISASGILRAQLQGDRAATQGVSMARELPERAHLELPIAPVASTSHSIVALTPAPPGAHRLVIWAVAPSLATGSRGAADAFTAVIRALASAPPLAFVVFDPRGDPVANATAVRGELGAAVIDEVLAIDSLGGSRLAFATIFGDLVPAIDDYAARAGAPAARTANAISTDAAEAGDLLIATGLSAFPGVHWILITSQGAAGESDDLRGEAAAVVAYAVARYAAGAPELVR